MEPSICVEHGRFHDGDSRQCHSSHRLCCGLAHFSSDGHRNLRYDGDFVQQQQRGATTSITNNTASWANANTVNLNGGTLQVTATTTLSESNSAGALGGTQTSKAWLRFRKRRRNHRHHERKYAYDPRHHHGWSAFNGSGYGQFTLTSSDNSNSTLIFTGAASGNGVGFTEGVTINGGTLIGGQILGTGGDPLTFGNNTPPTKRWSSMVRVKRFPS